MIAKRADISPPTEQGCCQKNTDEPKTENADTQAAVEETEPPLMKFALPITKEQSRKNSGVTLLQTDQKC